MRSKTKNRDGLAICYSGYRLPEKKKKKKKKKTENKDGVVVALQFNHLGLLKKIHPWGGAGYRDANPVPTGLLANNIPLQCIFPSSLDRLQQLALNVHVKHSDLT